MAITYFVSLLALLGGVVGGGNDLLDYLPTFAYWEGKNVPVTPEAMFKELGTRPPADVTKALADFAADDAAVYQAAAEVVRDTGPAALPALRGAMRSDNTLAAGRAGEWVNRISATRRAGNVRRLMAIRTLGELKAKETLPVLQRLAQSDEPFVADYARAAAAAIDGKPAARDRAAWVDRDVWLLPGGVRAVVCLAPKAAPPASMDETLRQIKLPPGQSAAGAAGAMARSVLPVAEMLGNIRFDGMTVGVSGELSEKSGYVVAVLRGRYDRDLLATILAEQKVPAKDVGGTPVYQFNQETAAFFPSNDRAVVISSPLGQALPAAEVVAAVQANGGGLRTNQEMIRLVQSTDTTGAFWAAVKMTDTNRLIDILMFPPLAAFDSLTLSGRQSASGAAEFTFRANGIDPAGVKRATTELNAGLKSLRTATIESEKNTTPSDTAAWAQWAMTAALDSLRITADGTTMTATITVKVSPADWLPALLRGLNPPTDP